MTLPRFNEANYAHFVTTKTFENKKLFEDEACCEIVLNDVDFYREKLGFKLLGYVIMPNHLHLIVWWDVERQKSLTISKIIQAIKSHSARQIVDYLYTVGRRGPLTSPKNSRLGQGTQATHDGMLASLRGDRVTRGEYPHRRMSEQQYKIWQPSFYDFNIYSEEKLNQKLNYIHLNPVRAKLCENPEDWLWSTARFYLTGERGNIRVDIL